MLTRTNALYVSFYFLPNYVYILPTDSHAILSNNYTRIYNILLLYIGTVIMERALQLIIFTVVRRLKLMKY